MKIHDPYSPDFRIGDRVRIVKLGGSEPEGRTGKLVGISAHVIMIYWIVQLDEPYFYEDLDVHVSCVSMPSVCLEPDKRIGITLPIGSLVVNCYGGV